VLTADPNGISGLIDVSPEGLVTYNAVSPDATIAAVASTPEPGSVWLFAGAVGSAFLLRRRMGALSSR
jgi:hypothetical protein